MSSNPYARRCHALARLHGPTRSSHVHALQSAISVGALTGIAGGAINILAGG